VAWKTQTIPLPTKLSHKNRHQRDIEGPPGCICVSGKRGPESWLGVAKAPYYRHGGISDRPYPYLWEHIFQRRASEPTYAG
jgi:hypothetical protein